MDLRPLTRYLTFRNARPILIVLGMALALWTSYQRAFERFELQTYDWRFSIRGPRPMHPDIVHVDIWNDTLETLGAWPFDREYHAGLIEALGEFGAKAVVFDVLFSEPHPSDPTVVAAAQKAKNVYFAKSFSDPRGKDGRFFAKKLDSNVLPAYEQAAKGVGFVNTKADLDGKRRRIMPVITHEGQDHYQLSFQVLFDILGIDRSKLRLSPGRSFTMGGVTVPLDEDGCMPINFAGVWESTYPHYSFAQIVASHEMIAEGMKPLVDPAKLKGKICLVGMTAHGSIDVSPVTVQPVYPLVGTHSNIINTVLMNDFIRRMDRASNTIILFLLTLATAWMTFYRRPLSSFINVSALFIVYAAVVINLFIYAGLWVDLFLPLLTMLLVYAGGTLTRIVLEMRKRELMESELKIASQIQQSFLPPSPPAQKGLDIAVFMRPAKAVGGDLYTFVPLGEDRLGVMVGDVSGKGTPAALFMGKVVSEFKYSARDCQDPALALTRLNDSIAAESTGGLFVTLSYAIFDLKNRTLTLSNAGHLPLVRASTGEGAALLQAEGGMPIGVMPGMTFENQPFPLKNGDCYAFYSDGISEARNKKKDEYGVELLQAVMSRGGAKAASPLLDEVVGEVTRFIGKADQHDDMTLILVKVTE